MLLSASASSNHGTRATLALTLVGYVWPSFAVQRDIHEICTQLAIDAGGAISKAQAMAIGSTNVEKLLGGKVETALSADVDLVATEGGDLLDFTSKVKAVISPRRGLVDLL